MAASGAKKDIDEQLAELEMSPRMPEEQEFIEACEQGIKPEQRAKVSEQDYLTVVRGYATYDPRKEETVKAFQVKRGRGEGGGGGRQASI